MTEVMRRNLGALLIAAAVLAAGFIVKAEVDESLGGNVALIGGLAVLACLLVIALDLMKAKD